MGTDLRAIEKIDPHHHLWDLDHNPYPWLLGEPEWRTYGDYRAICRNYLISDYLADISPHNIVASVHVQANWDADEPVEETRWCQKVADVHGFPHGIVAHADLTHPDVEALLDAHCEYDNMRGIRHIVGHTDDPVMSKRTDVIDDPSWERGYSTLASRELRFDLQAYPAQIRKIYPIIKRHENIPVVICHTGFPWDRSEAGRRLWDTAMSAMATLPHCYVKLSGPAMVMPDWKVETFAEYIHRTIDLFGPDRCMFASNIPPDTLSASLDEIYDAMYQWAMRYSNDECHSLFFETANKFYSLD